MFFNQINRFCVGFCAFIIVAFSAHVSFAETDQFGHSIYASLNLKPIKQDGKYKIKRSKIPAKVVRFKTEYKPGTIVIKTNERRLYHVLGNGKAKRYAIAVGRPGFAWKGVEKVSRKAKWPGWTPPPAMRKREPDLPEYMEGGLNNPLGARAIYLGSSYYRIHGSNQPRSIGTASSSGCFRMTNWDVIDLYDEVKVGAKVVVR